jgi:ABC-2 type transport system permease protein
MARTIYQSDAMMKSGLSPEQAAAILNASLTGEFVTVGKNFFQSYWIAYVLVFLLYMSTVLYGQNILVSVVTEKSSKAMELLITSARPLSLMFGKVFGTGCAGLAQFAAIMLCATVSLNVNQRGWEELSPTTAGIVHSIFSSGLLIYAVIFFLLGFFSFAFIFAALGSTVSRLEDANSVAMIPMLLIVATFFISMIGMTNPTALYVRICSFAPFISPMVMFVRICMTDIPLHETLLGIALNCAYVFGSGWISAKIYRVGIMLYGKPPKLRDIARYARQA